MKTILLIIFSGAFAITLNAQIIATTSSGRKVYLFSNGTWKYADNTKPDEVKSCATYHTGNVTFKNNSDKDLYVYYSDNYEFLTDYKLVRVKAKSSKTVADLSVNGSYNDQRITYYWKATYETALSANRVNELQSIENGDFKLEDCANKEIEINN